MGSTLEPTMRGTLALGATLTPVAAEWTGGWGDDVSQLSLFVCRTEGGEDLSLRGGPVARRARRAATPSRSTRAARTTTTRPRASGRRGVPAAVARRDRLGLQRRRPDRHDGRGRAADPGPAAPAGVTDDARHAEGQGAEGHTAQARLRSGKRLTVGSITCVTRCRVRLSVGDGQRTLKRTLSVRGTTRLTIVNGSKLRKQVRLRVVVTVDGKRLASGRVRN